MGLDVPDWTGVVSRPETQLAGSPWTPGAGTDVAKSFTVDRDAHAVALVIANHLAVTAVTVTGHTSGEVYYKVDPASDGQGPIREFLVHPSIDQQLDFVVTSSAGVTLYVSEVADPVTVETKTPALWQAPVTRAHLDVGNGTFPAPVVAGVAGLVIYVFGWELQIDSTAASRFARLYDSVLGAGTGDFATLDSTGTSPAMLTGTGSGGQLSSGAGISLGSTALNGEFVRVTVWYSQG